ncbi:heme biosynthesis protein HemY, partial [Thioclava sp. BHET1]
MIWTLVKILIFIAIVAAVTIGLGHLAQSGEALRMAFAGWEITLGPVQAVIAVLVLLAAMWIVFRLVGLLIAALKVLTGDETALTRYFSRNRERRGIEALSDAMLALASGEGRLALIKAQRAEKALNRPDLTNLIAAQAAEMVGDTSRAEEAYKRLLADERTRFVGVRGILKQKLAQGDTATALKLAEKAYALKPRHEDVQETLLQLQAGAGDWAGARNTLGAKVRTGNLPKDVHKRRDAALALQEARGILENGHDIEAQEAAIAANRQSPDLIPAAVMAARAYIAQDKPKYAARVISRAWEAAPHPDLAVAFAEIAPDESAAERVKRFALLTAIHPQNEQTRLLLAELNIAAEDFPAARRALGDLAETHPTARSLAIMAAIERGEGSEDAVVRGWLTKALTASRGPQWVCDKCQKIHADWAPVCDNCGGFDTLSWREVDQAMGPSATQAELLPVLVGQPDAKPAERPRSPTSGAGDMAEVE